MKTGARRCEKEPGVCQRVSHAVLRRDCGGQHFTPRGAATERKIEMERLDTMRREVARYRRREEALLVQEERARLRVLSEADARAAKLDARHHRNIKALRRMERALRRRYVFRFGSLFACAASSLDVVLGFVLLIAYSIFSHPVPPLFSCIVSTQLHSEGRSTKQNLEDQHAVVTKRLGNLEKRRGRRALVERL